MLLTIDNLTVQYGKQTVLQIDRPLAIEKGDRIGIIGSNGAGKTTLVKALLGLTDYQGSIRTSLTPDNMAVHMQFNNYVNTMSVKSIIEAILNTKIRQNDRLKELITFFDFEDCLRKRYSALSGGQKQRFTLILVLLQDAPLTFFDEVTSGLDFESRQRLMTKLTDWYQGRENTLVMVSHYYEELEQLADKILLLDKGCVIAYGSLGQLFTDYCGRAIITVPNTDENKRLLTGFELLASPAHLLALSCRDMKTEENIIQILLHHNINYKRSNNDIEIMSINAQQRYYLKAKGDNKHE